MTRSIGVNAVASREQEPDPVPPWESPAFLSSPSTQPSVWQELCAEAGESVTALIAANAAEGFDALLASNTTVRLDGLLSGVQTKVKTLHGLLIECAFITDDRSVAALGLMPL